MVTEQWMVEEVRKVVPDAEVEASDLHGSGDHFHVRQRQRPILNHFKPHIAQNIVHALDLKCMTPEQAGESGDTAFDPHGEEVEFFGVHIRRPDKE